MPTHEKQLLRLTRNVHKLERERNKLRRRLRLIKVELRGERRMLRALAQEMDRRPDVLPLRTFGGAVGLALTREEPEPAKPVSAATSEFVEGL